MTLSDLTSKTPEELNSKLHHALGFRWSMPNEAWYRNGSYVGTKIPNYTGSWDAIMPEVRKLDYDQQGTFTEHLIQVTMNSPHSTYCCCALASPTELTQALILTLHP